MKLLITARRIATSARAAVLSVTAPALLVQEQQAAAPDPIDVYTEADMPAAETIEAAAREYDRAADLARRADRSKRAAKKVLGKLPSGQYGPWKVFRTPSSRQVVDLAEVTRIFKAHGLGPVPMKPCADSLKVELVAVTADTVAELLAA